MLFGLIGALIVLVIIVMGVVGQTAASGSNGSGNAGQQPCAQCTADRAWYNSLKWTKKVAYATWYALRMAQCALSGC